VKRIRTERLIPFPAADLWAVLTDFRRYAEWNPLNVWADGYARLGARVPMRFVDAGGGKGKVIAQMVTVTSFEPARRLEWVGRIPLLFTGRHIFELEPSRGGTLLRHGEDMSGLVPALFFSAERVDRQRLAYEAFNEALEKRVGAFNPA
jgi:hypothetical protein